MPRGQYFRSGRSISRKAKLAQVDRHIQHFQQRKKNHEQAIVSLEREIEKRKKLIVLAQTHIDYCLEARREVETADNYRDILIVPWHEQQSETIKETWKDPEMREAWIYGMNHRERKGA